MEESKFLNNESLAVLKRQQAADNSKQIVEISQSVGEIIDFLNQLKIYTESAVTEHDKAISTVVSGVLGETQKLDKKIKQLKSFVIGLYLVTVGMAVYLCIRH